MSEAMALERLLLAAWELEGYWGRTRARVPQAGSWREIDVLAVRRDASAGTVVRVGEVKARGEAGRVYVLDETHASPAGFQAWLGDWGGFVDAAAALYATKQPAVAGLPAWSDLAAFELHFVVNAWWPPAVNVAAPVQEAVAQRLRDTWGYKRAGEPQMARVRATFSTTRDLVVDSIRNVRAELESGRGVRFGDPFLDAVREIMRYLDPALSRVPVVDGVAATRKAEAAAACRAETIHALVAALGIAPDEAG